MSRQPFWARSTRPCQHVNKSYKQWQMTNVNYIIAAQWSYSNSFANGRSSTIAGKLRNVKLDSSIVKSAHFRTCSPGTTRTILQKKFKNPSRVSLDELGFGHLRPEILVDSCWFWTVWTSALEGTNLVECGVSEWDNECARSSSESCVAADSHWAFLQSSFPPSFSMYLSLPLTYPLYQLLCLSLRCNHRIHIYTPSHTYHMYIYTVIYIHICMHAFIPTYIHTYIHTVHMYIHTDVRTYGGKGQHSWMQISVNIHTFHLQSLWQLAGMSTLSRRLDCKSEVLHRARSDLRAIRRFSSSWSWLPTILTSRAFLTWPVRRLVRLC